MFDLNLRPQPHLGPHSLPHCTHLSTHWWCCCRYSSFARHNHWRFGCRRLSIGLRRESANKWQYIISPQESCTAFCVVWCRVLYDVVHHAVWFEPFVIIEYEGPRAAFTCRTQHVIRVRPSQRSIPWQT